MREWIDRSATALARAIRSKEVSSREVVDTCLTRIEAVNPALNAVVQVDAESARAQAQQADGMLARGCGAPGCPAPRAGARGLGSAADLGKGA
jgi:Asp-tRNA(Asn)/Glu-tRNA(Gln) amidotransferase A subunit family amidase